MSNFHKAPPSNFNQTHWLWDTQNLRSNRLKLSRWEMVKKLVVRVKKWEAWQLPILWWRYSKLNSVLDGRNRLTKTDTKMQQSMIGLKPKWKEKWKIMGWWFPWKKWSNRIKNGGLDTRHLSNPKQGQGKPLKKSTREWSMLGNCGEENLFRETSIVFYDKLNFI